MRSWLRDFFYNERSFSAVMREAIVAVVCAGLVGPAAAELFEVKLKPGEAAVKQFTVAPGKFAELCAAVRQGQSVAWQFRADAAMDFNIHYHIEQRVEYPEQRKAVDNASGHLMVMVDQSYCWMWSNRSAAPIVLNVVMEEVGR